MINVRSNCIFTHIDFHLDNEKNQIEIRLDLMQTQTIRKYLKLNPQIRCNKIA